ncbi:probable 3',5'-cyclic phosphodiesterase pde-5 [Caerostris extrusa]|uniref:Probable 3',5'-cyclic phosphodiesterase pde-5 n=1 Tax=Caerostris extrusa TaxID=172846 RepID=A0AAV4X155_CAEEX|nr:probable 3',5'-cyclic phosphodiesterase pde-5 [Caerostris extrusa]
MTEKPEKHLKQEGHNIFSNLSSSDYKKMLNNIKHCILATDLALFFPNKKQIWLQLWRKEGLILITLNIACDLCGSTKSWDQQKEIVKVIFEEFYDQGDVEKSQGRQPLPVMDRSKMDEQPDSQVNFFLKGICIPCYELLYTLIPETEPMLDGCRKNLSIWENLAEERKKKRKLKQF